MIWLSCSKPTAKKQHHCDWCPEPIVIGEKYVRESAVYCGDFQELKFHTECRDACSEMARMNDGDFDIDFKCRRGTTELA